MSASAGVQQNLAKASLNADRLSRFLGAAGLAETTSELSMRLIKMSDDARVLSASLEKLSLRDADERDRVKAQRERERYHQKKTQVPKVPASTEEVQATMNVASEAAAGAAEQSYFFNWAMPAVEDESEAEVEEGQSV